ncbi:MAG: hypothetical protein NTY22_08165 [Proteobacteria bacterium]|nr:hypothetical protein [Pseudomonadota bacterium]
MKAFVIRPCFDDATRVTSKWGGKIIPLLRKKGLDVVDLSGNKANRDRIMRELENDHLNNGLFLFYGHGSDDRFIQRSELKDGEHTLKWFIDTQNVKLLKNKIVFTTCCLSGLILRQACIDEGGLAFLGYQDVFRFFSSPPLSDNFGECVNSGIKALLGGQDIYQVEQTMRTKYLEYEQFYYTGVGYNEYEFLSYDIADTFRHNKENLVVLSRDRQSVKLWD